MLGWIAARGDYKNVEMAQGFFLLASYGGMAENAMSDQTWFYLGTAIRIATELGCNLVCYSYNNSHIDLSKGAAGEHYLRQLRNTERLWINLWNLEKTLASQTGQRMHLADEGVIATCSRWDRMPTSLRQDEVLVAQVELRRVMIGQGDQFNTHVLRSLGVRRAATSSTKGLRTMEGEEDREDDAAERDHLSLQLKFFRNSVTMDLKRWEERWLPSHPTTSTSSNNDGPTPLQITGPLSLDYAALVTFALPLPITYTVNVTSELTLLYRQCYISCTNYMATFIDRSKRGYMDYVTNSFVVSTVYAVVFGLDLARKAQRKEGKGVDFGFVSQTRVLNLAKGTMGELEKIGMAKGISKEKGKGNGRGRMGNVAAKYSAFLKGVLARFDATQRTASANADGTREEEEEGEGGGEEGKAAAQRGGFVPHHHEGRDRLRRDHDTALSSSTSNLAINHGGRLPSHHHHHQPQQSWTTAAERQPNRELRGTKASQHYSSNIHFATSPLNASTAAGGGGGGGGWVAPAPSPSTPVGQNASTANWAAQTQAAAAAGGGADTSPSHHQHQYQQGGVDWMDPTRIHPSRSRTLLPPMRSLPTSQQ